MPHRAYYSCNLTQRQDPVASETATFVYDGDGNRGKKTRALVQYST